MTGIETFIGGNQLLAYLILFAGMFIEGDTFFVTAAILAHNRYLNWALIVLTAFTGMFISDGAFYFLGRYSRETKLGAWFFRRFKRYNQKLETNFIGNYATFALFAKFLYYVNRFAPFAAGWYRLEPRRLIKIHLITAAIWVSVMTVVGVIFGSIVELIGAPALLRRLWIIVISIFILSFIASRIIRRILTHRITANKSDDSGL